MPRSLDIEQLDDLLTYLRGSGYLLPEEVPTLRVLTGGVSNRTVLVERAAGESWVLKQALEKLRVAVDWFSPPERIHREALGLRWLNRLAPEGATVHQVFEDFQQHLLAMEAVPQPHQNWKTMLLTGVVEPDHVRQFGSLLGTIHRRGHERRDEIAAVFDDRSYFESLRLEPYYGYAASQTPEAAPFLTRLMDDTRAHRVTLVHGDYSPKNILVSDGRLVLLDHEVVHVGDPAFDLGFGLTHLLSKAHHLPELRAACATAAGEFWRAYVDAAGPAILGEDLESRAVRNSLGCLLARVAGRSPLEYLDATERQRQRLVVVGLLDRPPSTVLDLIDRFVESL